MGSIIFLRHGQAKNNIERILTGRTPGIPLTEKGIEQAEKAAKFLEHMNISAIYSSPIERARHTAEIVSKHNSLKVKIKKKTFDTFLFIIIYVKLCNNESFTLNIL